MSFEMEELDMANGNQQKKAKASTVDFEKKISGTAWKRVTEKML